MKPNSKSVRRLFAAAIVAGLGFSADAFAAKKGFVGDIDRQAASNKDFRRVLYTGRHLQLVLMTLQAGEEIGAETHAAVDQFFRFESGTGEIRIGGKRSEVKAGIAAVVPAGTEHNVRNTGNQPLVLYTIYAPPQHADRTVHATKADAGKSSERFTGKTSE